MLDRMAWTVTFFLMGGALVLLGNLTVKPQRCACQCTCGTKRVALPSRDTPTTFVQFHEGVARFGWIDGDGEHEAQMPVDEFQRLHADADADD